MQGSSHDTMFSQHAQNLFAHHSHDDPSRRSLPLHGQARSDQHAQPLSPDMPAPAQQHQFQPQHQSQSHTQSQSQSHLPTAISPHQAPSHHHHPFAFQQQQHFNPSATMLQPDPNSFAHPMHPPSHPSHRAAHADPRPQPALDHAMLNAAFLQPTHKQLRPSQATRTYLDTFEDPIAEAYIAGQTLDEPFYSVATPQLAWPADGSTPVNLGTTPNTASQTTDHPPAAAHHSLNNAHPATLDDFTFIDKPKRDPSTFDSAAAILDDAGFTRFSEINDDEPNESVAPTRASAAAGPSSSDALNQAASGSVAAAAKNDAIPPRRRTRRRQNISCDQCRASKRGCDFQLRLDADGNDLNQPDDPAAAGNPGDKRKLSDAGQEAASGAKLVCSNCQRRGIECTTNFADSVRESKQATTTTATDPASSQGSKKRAIADDASENGVRSKSVSTDGSSPAAQEGRDQLIRALQSRSESNMLSTSGANVRFAMRADSLLLTTNRMRLYVHTVEPSANLWLSRACSPLRTDGDLGAYIRSAVGMDALSLSQRLWSSWHVDAPSPKKEHQPNLFYLVYGLDHLGGEMGVWGEKPQPFSASPNPASANQRGPDSAQEASAHFNDIFTDMLGMGPGGWRRSKRDLMIDEAVKAAMLAYACQFRLDDEMTSSTADAASKRATDGVQYRDAHDRIATAAWKRARSLILQLAPRRSCRIAYGLFLFGVTAPPPGALAEGGSRSGADAAEDAAFALETASRHLEWFVQRCRDLVRTVDKAVKNPLLSSNPEVIKQQRIAADLMGLAESLGWFGLLIDTVTHVSQGRRSSMREDNLVYQSTGIGSGTDPGLGKGVGQTPSSVGSPPDRTAEALFAMQDALNLLPSRQAPPGAFPGTSESYMHEESEVDGTFQVDTEMSRRIMERAACARDLIPALLRNPGALANAIPFDVLIGAQDPDAAPSAGPIINIQNPNGGLNEQVVLLGVAWGTAVEVYIWRRVGMLQAATEQLLAATDPVQALIAGGGSIVTEKVEKMVMNVLEAIRLFHSIFDGLIARALDEFVHLSRQARTMLSFFVIHIHLGVLHFTQLAKRIEQKELELIQAFNTAHAAHAAHAGSPPQTASTSSGVNLAFSPLTVNSPPQPPFAAGLAASPKGGAAAGGAAAGGAAAASGSSNGSPPSSISAQSVPHQPLRSVMLHSSVERRIVGKAAALGMAHMASLVNGECETLEEAARIGRLSPKSEPHDGKARKGSFYAASPAADDFTPIEDSSSAPWRHPYPAMVADALKLSSQQLHDEIWDQLIAVPRQDAELALLMDNFNVLLEGFSRMLHAVPGLGSYKQVLTDLENARDTAAFVATQNS